MLIKLIALVIKTSDYMVTSKVPSFIRLALILIVPVQVIIKMASSLVFPGVESGSTKKVSIVPCSLNIDPIIDTVNYIINDAQ